MSFKAEFFGQRVLQLRRNAGVSQTQFAKILNISHKHMSNLEHGIKGPSIDLLVIIAEYFHVSLDFLILGQETNDVMISELQQEACKALVHVKNIHNLISVQNSIADHCAHPLNPPETS